LLNPNLTHSLYQNDGFDSPIDGFIFKFISDDGITKPVSAKLIDPYMTNIILKNKSNKGFKDNTDVLLSDFAVFMAGQDMDSILLHGDDESQRYLELFYRLFNRYIKYKKSQLEDFDVDTNDIVKESIDVDFDVNLDEISNETTKKLLKDNPEYKSIFKTLLGSFKAKKPEDYKSLVMSPGVVRIFNGIIDKIQDKISNKTDGNDLSFSSYLNTIHPKNIMTLDVKNVQDNVQPKQEEERQPIQALSFADFKKKDKDEENEKKEQKAIKSIEDMIKDLQKDMDKLKGSVKKQEEKEEESEEREESEEKKEKEEKSEDKKDEKDQKEDVKKEEKKEEKPSNEEDDKSKEEPKEEEKKDDEKEDDNPLANL
jgi:hypothetical protein